MRFRATTFYLLVMATLVAGTYAQKSEDRLFSASELRTIDRENAMWRLTRVQLEPEDNKGNLLAAGFSQPEVDLILPRLRSIWAVDLKRDFGLLPSSAINRIQSVDRDFVFRLRAARRYAETGTKAEGYETEEIPSIRAEWDRAIFRVLDSREITEFRLLNSTSANYVHDLAKGLRLSIGERRALCAWQREFENGYGGENQFPDQARAVRRQTVELEHWARVRQLLGDPRFSVYLSRAEADYDVLNQTLNKLPESNPTCAVDLWFIRQQYQISLAGSSGRQAAWDLLGDANAKVAGRLGGDHFNAFKQTAEGAWLNRK